MLPMSDSVLISHSFQRMSSATTAAISCGATRDEIGSAGVAMANTVGVSGSAGTWARTLPAPRVTCRYTTASRSPFASSSARAIPPSRVASNPRIRASSRLRASRRACASSPTR